MTTSDFPWEQIYPFLSSNMTICRGILGSVVATQGSGPYEEDAFDEFLMNSGIQVRNISDDCPPDVAVFGRQDWDEDEIDELRRNCSERIRVYSQEMVVASMAIGADIFDFDEEGETVLGFVQGHPALECFHANGLVVPGLPRRSSDSDSYEEPTETLQVSFEADSERPAVGILGDMGYRVGKVKGLPRHQRHAILWRTFRVHLIATSPWTEEYISEWGARCSSQRFNKMCNVLRRLINTARRKTAIDMSVAISEWEEDLQFLLENESDWLTHAH